jgi:hypothetical protein
MIRNYHWDAKVLYSFKTSVTQLVTTKEYLSEWNQVNLPSSGVPEL